MKPYLFILSFSISLFIACNNKTEEKVTDTKMVEVLPAEPPPPPPPMNVDTPRLSKIDSIDKVNAAMVSADKDFILKATINKDDSTIWLTANMRMDHRIFGYEKPDANSKRMFLLSIFTDDVKDNPFNLPYGAYYQTNDMDNKTLKYISTQGKFVKVAVIE